MGFKSNLKSTEVKSVLILFLYAYMTVLGQFLSTARYCAGLILRCSIFIYHSQLQKLEKLVFSPSHSDRNTNLKVFFFFFLICRCAMWFYNWLKTFFNQLLVQSHANAKGLRCMRRKQVLGSACVDRSPEPS